MQIKTKPQHWIHLCVFLLLLLPALTAQAASRVTVGDLSYDLDPETKTASVYGPKSSSTQIHNLTIPEEITWEGQAYLVTSIRSMAFYNCSDFTGSLTIGNSVTTIGNSAFGGCSGFTGSLNIPNSVTSIGQSAFDGCSGFTGSLTIGNSVTTIGAGAFTVCGFTGSLMIPNSVTSIGQEAFMNCRGFTGSLTIGNSVTTIGESAFEECNGFTGSLTIPNSVIAIGKYAFLHCNGFTGSLTIGNSVTTIGANAFVGCKGLTNLQIGSGVKEIGYQAFYSTSFNDITSEAIIPPSIIVDGSFNTSFTSSNYRNPLYVPAESLEAYKTAYEWKEFTQINPIVGGGTGSIELDRSSVYLAVGDNLTLTATVLPEDTTDKSVTWESSDNAVVSVTSGKITGKSAGVATITATTLNGLSASCQVTVMPSSPFTFTFDEATKTATVTGLRNKNTTLTNPVIPDATPKNGELYDVTAINDKAFSQSTKITGTLTIGENITTIGNSAFSSCTKLTGSLNIPSSVITIGNSAFYNCYKLTGSLNIPNSVTAIGNYAFSECSSLQELTLPNSLTAIGNYAFNKCSGLTGSLTIPNSVTAIGNYAFYECKGFSGSLTIGDSVTTIGDYAFYYCSGFTGSLTIPNSVTTIGGRAFAGCKGFTGSLTIPNSVTTIGDSAFSSCSGLNGELTLSEQLVELGSYAFSSCSNLTGTIRIPDSLTSISSGTFEDCAKIEHIVLPSTMTSISAYSFHGCTGLQSVTCYALTPPELLTRRVLINDNAWYPSYAFYWAFEDNVAKNTYLYVESESIELYKKRDFWKQFKFASIEPDGITLDKDYVSLHPSEQVTITAILTPDDALNKSVTWVSSDEGIASVVDGVVTANGWGTATITATTVNGLSASCEVTVWLMGDVNNDGVINVADVSLTSSYIAGLNPEDFTVEAADINGDGDITVTDAVLIARLILNAESVSAQSIRKVRSLATESGIMNVTRNGEMISLSLHNAGYTALQADLRLPDGVSLTDVTLCEKYSNSHVIMTADKGDNIVRLVVFSVNNAEFISGEDIVRIALPASSSGNIEGLNIIAADADGRTANMSLSGDGVVNGVVTIPGTNGVSITPIGDGIIVRGASQQTIHCFTADGLPAKSVIADSDNVSISLATGIYIIKVGTKTQKVIIK